LSLLSAFLLLGNRSSVAATQIAVATPLYEKEAGELFTTSFSYSASGGTTGDLTSFDIELRSHASASATTGCGETVFASLCTRDGGVCMDSDGSYDVQIPEDAPAGKYSIKVMLSEDSMVWACTDAFNVTLPRDGAGLVVVAGEPAVEEVQADASASGGLLSPGLPFTARWVYDDGAGDGGEGTFEVNLNACGAVEGDCDTGCGTFSVALCGDDGGGCYDPGTGDYDVLIPADQPLGEYKLEVISTADSGVSGCSESSFFLVAEGTDPADTPTAAPVATTPAPSPPPLPTFAPVTPTPAPMVAPTGGPSAADSASPVSLLPVVTSAPSVAVATSTPSPSGTGTVAAPAAATESPSASEASDSLTPSPDTAAPSVVAARTPSPTGAATAADAVATLAPLPATTAPSVAAVSTPSPTDAAAATVAAATPAPTVTTTSAATLVATDKPNTPAPTPITPAAVATPSPIAAAAAAATAAPIAAPTAAPIAAPVAAPAPSPVASSSEGEPGSPGFPPSPV
ncbi:unnamed protein product, partial [Hapterophycus canaliculatus]